jgi:hypothetical protein
VSLLAGALSRAQEFLLAPAAAGRPARAAAVRSLDVAVVGLKAGSGASTIAAGLNCALSSAGTPRADVHEVEPAALIGRRPDITVLVVPEDVEPALVSLVTGIVGERVGTIVVVANRVRDRERWRERAAICLPNARVGAMFTGAGRAAPGQLGAAFAELADIVLATEAR